MKKIAFTLMMTLLLGVTACQETAEGDQKEGPAKTMAEGEKSGQQGQATASNEDDREKAKEAIQHLMDICREDDYSRAAPFIVYRGEDEARQWKDVCDWSKEEEQAYVSSTCASIQVILEGVTQTDFMEFVQETESEGTWNVWMVRFTYEDGSTEQTAFAMLKIGQQFALGDLD